MVDEIITGISKRLKEAFPGCRIYAENVEQGLMEPCFLIVQTAAAQSPYPSSRYRQTNDYDVHYFPDRRGCRAEAHDVAQQLYDCLEYVDLPDGPLRGTGMHYEYVDGVMHFFVSYNLFALKVKNTPYMEELDTDTNLKR